MWIYEKKLQVPVKVSCTNVKLAKLITAQYGGPDGELSASLRYLNQRYSMPTDMTRALLTDVGTEELAHMEIIATLVHKLTEHASCKDFKEAGWEAQYVQHGGGLFWADVNGTPWSASYLGTLGDPITDLTEDLAAEQKARATYEHLICCSDDPCVNDVLRFLWEREIVHIQRFGEALEATQEWLYKSKNNWKNSKKCKC
jgi:spore coat protein JC